MFAALATLAQPLIGNPGLPTLCGIYASRADAIAYVAWENDRADDAVYYVTDADALTAACMVGEPDTAIAVHDDSEPGEPRFHWSAEERDGTVRSYGTDFHPTPGEAWRDADRVLCDLLNDELFASLARMNGQAA